MGSISLLDLSSNLEKTMKHHDSRGVAIEDIISPDYRTDAKKLLARWHPFKVVRNSKDRHNKVLYCPYRIML
uniref:Uncharacterized protein n=1 Tax=Rhizophora mucronata TaxID=61149 RepID=A0A2P2MFU0_RHIMU